MGSAALRTLNWAALRYKHTAALRSALEKKYAPASVNQMLCALRRVLKEALRLDLIDPLDYSKAGDVRSVKQSGKPRGRALSPDEIAALVQSCSGESTVGNSIREGEEKQDGLSPRGSDGVGGTVAQVEGRSARAAAFSHP
jgi:hypothetical protein